MKVEGTEAYAFSGSAFSFPGGSVQTSVTTIERFIFDQEHRYPEATGELSNLL